MNSKSTALVIGFLRVQGGYRDVPTLMRDEEALPLPGTLLLGPEGQSQLVVVRHAEADELRMVERGIRAFCLRLDKAQPSRSLTLVLVSSSVRETDVEPIRRICRVLVCEYGTELHRSLRPLLPLRLPEPITPLESAEHALQSVLGNSADDPVVRRLVKAGRTGADEVGLALQELLESAIRPALEEG
jgi:hypothetical protein